MNSRKYKLDRNSDPSMELRQFGWQLDSKNNAVLTWEWPTERSVKLMLIFECGEDDENPNIRDLLKKEHPHEVVVRDLGAKFSVNIPEGRRKFLVCPAYFDDSKSVVVYEPVYVTDWLYKRTVITAKVQSKPLPLSQFQHMSFRITASDMTQLPLITQVMKYVIHEQGRLVGKYPLDATIMAGGGHFYIKKDQAVKFQLDEGYDHLLEIQS